MIVSVAGVASLGVASGGWRIIRTLGMSMTGLDPVQGFAAETSAATVRQLASGLGIPVSTSHAITAAIVGAGTVHGRKRVRWQLVVENERGVGRFRPRVRGRSPEAPRARRPPASLSRAAHA